MNDVKSEHTGGLRKETAAEHVGGHVVGEMGDEGDVGKVEGVGGQMGGQVGGWEGYLREDGRKGVRNLVLVIYTVECASFVAQRIAEGEQDTHVIGFPGCYDNAYAIRLMLALARHPNVGAVLAVGLGCEYTQPKRIADVVRESGRPAANFFIQDVGGTETGIAKGKQIVNQMREQITRDAKRVTMTMADLVIGCECGGSDGTSGLAGNPVVGRLFDRLVDAGGLAVFEETVEMIGLKEMILSRAAHDEAREALAHAYDKAMAYCQEVRQFSAAPGNFAGGLTTIEEKSLGAFAKSGSRAIEGVVKVGEPVWHRSRLGNESEQSMSPESANPSRGGHASKKNAGGLWLLDSVPDAHFMQFGYTNANDSEGLMDLIAAGCQIVLFVTGRGSVIGSPIAPLIKVTGNRQTYERMQGDMDFCAAGILEGRVTLDECADELLALVLATASGAMSKPERLGHREFFIPYKHQDVPLLQVGCRV